MASSFTVAAQRWPRWLSVMARRRRWLPRVELLALTSAIVIGAASYLILTGGQPGDRLLTPPLAALLLVANLIPAIALIVLLGRRVAKGRAVKSMGGGQGRLHVRLVGVFSLIASIPMLLLVVFASLLFQYGVEFWFSTPVRSTLQSAADVAQQSYIREQDRVTKNAVAMAGDVANALGEVAIDDPAFAEFLGFQISQRELSEGMILRARPGQEIQTLALINPYERNMRSFVSPAMTAAVRAGRASIFVESPNGVGALTKLPIANDNFLYVARIDVTYGQQIQRARAVLANYRSLQNSSQRLQLQFNAALFLISLLIVGGAVAVAIAVADRMIKPVSELVAAAQRVSSGDLKARVRSPRSNDELAVLGNTFNRMTERLDQQRSDLVAASDLIDRRRAFIEAVLSGVTAGVVAVGEGGNVRILNRSAMALLGTDDSAAGQPLPEVSAELAEMLGSGEREAIVELRRDDETRTLAVKVSQDELGQVLTFDDITAQLVDQRRAAWADVARRIAHEIKNPLTPIQLAAERLKRRFTKEIASDPDTFGRLTDTIVRQVGDLRRMVDEFSSFARMPKPVFREEALIEICRQAVFLHEVAHPQVRFEIDAPDPELTLVCDRRQLGQALTNLVKNAVEAIETGGTTDGKVIVRVVRNSDVTQITVEDNGVGLPVERDRLSEPYITTRAGGTGLGLAIVRKIVEEHGGTLRFEDGPAGGALIRMAFGNGLAPVSTIEEES